MVTTGAGGAGMEVVDVAATGDSVVELTDAGVDSTGAAVVLYAGGE